MKVPLASSPVTASGRGEREVVKVKAITHRKGAYFYDMNVGHLDHMLLSTIPMEANLFRAVRSMIPSVKACAGS